MGSLSPKKQRILVTGGAGFLGSHLCERLLAEENEVICLDNFFTGRRENIAHLMSNPQFELLRHDAAFSSFSVRLRGSCEASDKVPQERSSANSGRGP